MYVRCVASATASVLKSTPRKLNLVAGLIRDVHVHQAMLNLKFSNKKASLLVAKVLKSAISNADFNGADIDALYVGEVLVGKSMTLKRVRAKAMGRAARIKKRYSNLTIKLFRGV